jgi:hypothetical protein
MEVIDKISYNDQSERKYVILWQSGGQERWSCRVDRDVGEA